MKYLFSALFAVAVIAASLFFFMRDSSEPIKLPIPKTQNKAAENLSKFYAGIKSAIFSKDPVSKNVIILIDTKDELENTLKNLRAETLKSPKPDRRLKGKQALFRQGQTVKTELEKFAQQEQLTIVWTLPRDYVIKADFIVSGDIIAISSKIAGTVKSDFMNTVSGFFCESSQAIVITDMDDMSVLEGCRAVTKNT